MPNPPRENNISSANEDAPRGKGPYRFLFRKQPLSGETHSKKEATEVETRTEGSTLETICDRERAHKRNITVATHNVRMLAIDGKHGMGRAADVFGEYRQMGLDIIILQEKCRDGQSRIKQAGYLVYYSWGRGDKGGGKKDQGGIGLAIRETITRAVVRPPEFISKLLLKVTLNLHCRASAVSFVDAYGPSDCTRDENKKRTFWAILDRRYRRCPSTNSCL